MASSLPVIAQPLAPEDVVTWTAVLSAADVPLACARGTVLGHLYALDTQGNTPSVYQPAMHTIFFAAVAPSAGLKLTTSPIAAMTDGWIVARPRPTVAKPVAAAAKPGRKRKEPVPAAASVVVPEDDSDDDMALALRAAQRKKPTPVCIHVKGRGNVRQQKMQGFVQACIDALGMTAHYTITANGGSFGGCDGAACTLESHVDVLRHIKDTFQIDVTSDLAKQPDMLFSAVVTLDDSFFE